MPFPRLPLPVAVLLAPAALNAFVVVGAGLLSTALGREPNPETAYLLMPGPMALALLRLADVYGLSGARRRAAVLAGVVASLGWWVVGVAAIAAAARLL